MTEKLQQVLSQCKAVAHLASALANIHGESITIYGRVPPPDGVLDIVGARTAAFMETLGDMLNDMDAVTDDDAWLAPVFAEAQRLWPSQGEPQARSVAVDPVVQTGQKGPTRDPQSSSDSTRVPPQETPP